MQQKYSLIFILWIIIPAVTAGQVNFQQLFEECGVEGSITIYDYDRSQWIYSDSLDSTTETLPASTFKIINTLIAIETGVIEDESQVVEWPGSTDTVKYGYRPDIYHDMTIKEAFQKSAGWVYVELAKQVGKDRYLKYLKSVDYGNLDLSHPDTDFWNFGGFGISPKNQIRILIGIYEESLPFSPEAFDIVKRIMVTEKTSEYVIRAKTGWTRYGGKDTGWWVGYIEVEEDVYFFATRIMKPRNRSNPNFGECRKEITKNTLRQLEILE
ncbi:MAG: penicillin binding protein transpeptidase domain-containing protein [Candidatus Marinimicrobia bacterium]|nr:penicillin binding protein transpeptidase domain-containing protein [Candidatus Neomarinimicrobiota bacterium]